MAINKAFESAVSVARIPANILSSVSRYLQAQQQELKKRQKRLKKEDPFANTERTSDNAAIDTDVNEQVGHERVQGIATEVDKMLIRVRQALTRIKLGKYGVCSNCNKLIQPNRLLINPTAEFCVDCERKFEKNSTE